MNKKDLKQYNRAYYLKHKAELVEYHKNWYLKNKEKVKLQSYNWFQNNKERYYKRRAEWKLKNPGYNSWHNHRRKGRIKGLVGSFTLKEWQQKQKEFNYRCAYCKKKKKLTVDHIIPAIKGGTNFITNIQPLCHSCNSHKNAQLITEPYWLNRKDDISAVSST